jgi:hypothetical protein
MSTTTDDPGLSAATPRDLVTGLALFIGFMSAMATPIAIRETVADHEGWAQFFAHLHTVLAGASVPFVVAFGMLNYLERGPSVRYLSVFRKNAEWAKEKLTASVPLKVAAAGAIFSVGYFAGSSVAAFYADYLDKAVTELPKVHYLWPTGSLLVTALVWACLERWASTRSRTGSVA